MEPSYKQPISVLVVIYTLDLQVLLLERAGQPGLWQSVTGSRDDEETLLQTAVREVAEETGLEAQRFQLSDWGYQNTFSIYPQWRHRYAPGVTENTEHVFGLLLPKILPIVVSPREHLGYTWLGVEAAAEKCFSPSNAEAINRLIR
ncbi:MAG: dihydroneopterin triphosphate diphosphatase [Sulfuriferula sp.]